MDPGERLSDLSVSKPSQPRPLIVSTSDIQGGASRASYRLHQGLQRIGVESRVLSFHRTSGDPTVVKIPSKLAVQQVKLSGWFDKQPLELYPGRQSDPFWSLNWFPNAMARQINSFKPDIVHLQWIGNGFIPIRALKRIKVPIVWTLHDMWAFTGGCHYAGECTGFQASCGRCPQLGSNYAYDLSWWTHRHKRKNWKNLNLTIVTPSHWLAECARASTLLSDVRVEVIPYVLNISQFKPIDRQLARRLLNLPEDKTLILFGALNSLLDKRKGVQFLHAALQKIAEQNGENTELIIFGATKPTKASMLDFGHPVHYMGHLSDDIALALVYSAADVMIVPSTQEAFGQTASESMACGTPVVAFNTTGLRDIVVHKETGYLAQPFEVNDLAAGIQWVLEDPERHQELRLKARRVVEERFDPVEIAQRHLNLYYEILDATSKAR